MYGILNGCYVVKATGHEGESMMRFGEYLRTLRLQLGFTQAELANKVGVSNTYVSALESGRKPAPPRAIVEALAQALKVPEKSMWHIAYAEREQRLLERIEGIPTSLRQPWDSQPAPTSVYGNALRSAFETLDQVAEESKSRKQVIAALEQFVQTLRDRKDAGC